MWVGIGTVYVYIIHCLERVRVCVSGAPKKYKRERQVLKCRDVPMTHDFTQCSTRVCVCVCKAEMQIVFKVCARARAVIWSPQCVGEFQQVCFTYGACRMRICFQTPRRVSSPTDTKYKEACIRWTPSASQHVHINQSLEHECQVS